MESNRLKVFFIFIYLLKSLSLHSQNDVAEIISDSTIIWGVTKHPTYFSTKPDGISQRFDYTIPANEPLFIYGYYPSTMKFDKAIYYGFYYQLDSGFVEKNDISISPEFEEHLWMRRDTGINIRKIVARLGALNYYQKELKRAEIILKEYDSKGLVLTGKDYAYADIGNQFGLTFTFYNGYSKDIKYINFTVRPYNRVGDITKDDFGRDKATGQIIGPLKSKTKSSVTFDDMFWDDNDIITCLQITYFKITFMDGTIKEIYDVYNHLGEGISNKCKN